MFPECGVLLSMEKKEEVSKLIGKSYNHCIGRLIPFSVPFTSYATTFWKWKCTLCGRSITDE